MKYLAFKVTDIVSEANIGCKEKLYFYNRALTNKSNIESIKEFSMGFINDEMDKNSVSDYKCEILVIDTKDINKNFKKFIPIEPTRDKEDVAKIDKSNFIPTGSYRSINIVDNI